MIPILVLGAVALALIVATKGKARAAPPPTEPPVGPPIAPPELPRYPISPWPPKVPIAAPRPPATPAGPQPEALPMPDRAAVLRSATKAKRRPDLVSIEDADLYAANGFHAALTFAERENRDIAQRNRWINAANLYQAALTFSAATPEETLRGKMETIGAANRVSDEAMAMMRARMQGGAVAGADQGIPPAVMALVVAAAAGDAQAKAKVAAISARAAAGDPNAIVVVRLMRQALVESAWT